LKGERITRVVKCLADGDRSCLAVLGFLSHALAVSGLGFAPHTQPWIVGVQLYRALGVIFLILYATDKMPALFAWPAGAGDVTVGLLAPVVALAYARDPRRNAGLVTAWNVLGILDLVVAVTTGFITSPSALLVASHPTS
jgi:hypothetical protein